MSGPADPLTPEHEELLAVLRHFAFATIGGVVMFALVATPAVLLDAFTSVLTVWNSAPAIVARLRLAAEVMFDVDCVMLALFLGKLGFKTGRRSGRCRQ